MPRIGSLQQGQPSEICFNSNSLILITYSNTSIFEYLLTNMSTKPTTSTTCEYQVSNYSRVSSSYNNSANPTSKIFTSTG